MAQAIKRVAILGHSGFIGSQLVRIFEKESSGVEIIGRSFPEVDLTKAEDVQGLENLFDSETAVILCSGIKKQFGDSLAIFSKNIQMVMNLCDLLRKHPVHRLVYFSSAEVYGENVENVAIDEKTPVNPVSFYGIAKYASEGLIRAVLRPQESSSLLILRPPLIYGCGDISKGYGPTGFAWAVANNQEITLWGDGTEHRDFVFVEDLARIVHRLTFHNFDGVVNVASGRSHSYVDIVEILERLAPHQINIVSRSRTKDQVNQGYSNDLLMSLLPDFRFTSLEGGVGRTLAGIQEQLATDERNPSTR